MTVGKARHFFPGGNTPKGFFSYYDNIIAPDTAHIFILKGGPGVGKSTFMKRMGAHMVAKGYDIEFHHCSSDNNSLDGLVIPKIGIAFIDGTAPHIVDPKHPGCVDEIIHLGDFWHQEKLVKNKEKILNCNKEISRYFQHAYRMLQGAKSIYDDWKSTNLDALNRDSCNQKINMLRTEIFSHPHSGAGKLRKLFASAITPDGPVNYIPSIVEDMTHQYIITGDPGTGKSLLIQNILDTALLSGFHTEAYYCPFEPSKPEHLVIPALQTAIITSSFPHTYQNITAPRIDMSENINKAVTALYADEIQFARSMYWDLFNKAVNYINKAKKLHDQLETYYVPNMDFAAVENTLAKTLNRVLAYEQ